MGRRARRPAGPAARRPRRPRRPRRRRSAPCSRTVGEAVGAPGLAVVAVGSHDTASAVVGVPLAGDESAYVSLGTWGLVGLELDAPVLTEAARAANFTHEGGVDGTIRFLTNVMGTWLLSETLRTWGRDDLRRAARRRCRRHRSRAGLRRAGPALRRPGRHAGAHRGVVRRARRGRAGGRREPRALDRREPRRGVRRCAAHRRRAVRPDGATGARRRRRQPEHAPLPGPRRPHRPARRRRPGRGDRPRQRARPGSRGRGDQRRARRPALARREHPRPAAPRARTRSMEGSSP